MIGWLRRRPGSKPLEGLRIYLASRTARQAEMSAIAEELVSAGAEVTSRWLGGAPLGNKELEPAGRASRLAKADLEDLCRADVCIAFTEKPGSSPGRGGRHTEFGIALALDKRVLVVGPLEHVFHCLPSVERYASWPAARESLIRANTARAPEHRAA